MTATQYPLNPVLDLMITREQFNITKAPRLRIKIRQLEEHLGAKAPKARPKRLITGGTIMHHGKRPHRRKGNKMAGLIA